MHRLALHDAIIEGPLTPPLLCWPVNEHFASLVSARHFSGYFRVRAQKLSTNLKDRTCRHVRTRPQGGNRKQNSARMKRHTPALDNHQRRSQLVEPGSTLHVASTNKFEKVRRRRSLAEVLNISNIRNTLFQRSNGARSSVH